LGNLKFKQNLNLNWSLKFGKENKIRKKENKRNNHLGRFSSARPTYHPANPGSAPWSVYARWAPLAGIHPARQTFNQRRFLRLLSCGPSWTSSLKCALTLISGAWLSDRLPPPEQPCVCLGTHPRESSSVFSAMIVPAGRNRFFPIRAPLAIKQCPATPSSIRLTRKPRPNMHGRGF
jgi:hypothetical protein